MTERVADINARIDSIGQLGAVVNAMRGIAAARAQQARGQLGAVEVYTATIAAAIGRAVALLPARPAGRPAASARPALLLFCAEQGFAGAFTQRVLDAAGDDLARCDIFLIGTRGGAVAAERGVTPAWRSAMPSHSLAVPKIADRIAEELYARIAAGGIDRLEVMFTSWQPGQNLKVQRSSLFPLDMAGFRPAQEANPPLLNLPPDQLLTALTADYLHAQLCYATLQAFAAENEARMEAMAAAHTQINRKLDSMHASKRQVRQEEITAEIIELAAGERASERDEARKVFFSEEKKQKTFALFGIGAA